MRAGSNVSILFVAITTYLNTNTVCIQTGFMEGFCWGAPLKTQYLSFSPVVKAIQLVEKLQHCPLNLPLSATVTLIPGQYFHTRSHGEDLHEISHSLAEHL